MTKKYTTSNLKEMLVEFHNHHPRIGDSDEWYGDQAHMTSDCVYQFIKWVETGEYDGSLGDEHIMDEKTVKILGVKEL